MAEPTADHTDGSTGRVPTTVPGIPQDLNSIDRGDRMRTIGAAKRGNGNFRRTRSRVNPIKEVPSPPLPSHGMGVTGHAIVVVVVVAQRKQPGLARHREISRRFSQKNA